SEVNFGHFPGGPVSKQISALMRPREAVYYILTGDQFNGKRAAEIGLITYSVPREQLEEEVQKLVEKLCAKQSLALRACKEAYRDSLLIPDIEAALSYSGAKSDQLSFLSEQRLEGSGDQTIYRRHLRSRKRSVQEGYLSPSFYSSRPGMSLRQTPSVSPPLSKGES